MKNICIDQPRSFHLTSRSSLFGIVLKVHRSVIRDLDFQKYAYCIKEATEELQLGDFDQHPWQSIGFNHCLCYEGSYRHLEIYSMEFPLWKKNSEICPYCHANTERHCLYCNGKGFNALPDSKAFRAAAASLSIFLQMISSPDKTPRTKKTQLIQLGTTTKPDLPFEPYAMSGKISGALQKWMKQSDCQFMSDYIQNHMRIAYSWMLGNDENLYPYFRAKIDPKDGSFHLSCPGNACGIDPSEDIKQGLESGYSFQSHNMTNPVQQLTMIAGLAAICEIAHSLI